MDNEAQFLLDDTIAFCQRDGQDERLIRMLRQCRAIALENDVLTLEAPSRYALANIERNRPLIEGYLEQIAFAPIALAAVAAGAPDAAATPSAPSVEPVRESAPAPGAAQTPASTPVAQATAPQTSSLQAVPAFPTAAFPVPGDTGEIGGVRIKTTLSASDYAKMMGQMREDTGAAAPAATAAAQVSPTPKEARPQVPINSKFTFATFVYGDENKHAYHSAQRFAAFADEPGQCNSLFIYGGSGLGKTHLLLAIKNYLAENKPHIRVKYANSQAYIDDFINEIARQKSEGRAILREYHEANVLIIDDIQNIIGKQASIEYFFSLMDEFIRENKKVVIASDRAPKKLGMDERLTSRFNAGMLCLVSEPGFEMKYMILKRYYESIIMGGSEDMANVDTSLLGAFQSHEGKLTDEQLRLMAEISGNNIRELESFCERCASLSFEREAAGGELSGADIEKVADEYYDTAHKIIHIDTVQNVVEGFYHVSHEELIGPKRSRDIAFARHVAVYLANQLCDLSSKAIGEEFGGRDHSTVINSLKVVEKKMKEDRRICEDLQQLKNKITLRS